IVRIGGRRRLPINAGDVQCRNNKCKFAGQRVHLDFIASMPPIAVDGSDEFWHEYQGGDLEFGSSPESVGGFVLKSERSERLSPQVVIAFTQTGGSLPPPGPG
ncbi:MAG TPA: hypothetical protein VGG10_10305, partial [Rhizomicrobium sp.]